MFNIISLLFIQKVKYTFGFLVVAMVSHNPVLSPMAVTDVRAWQLLLQSSAT